MLTIAMILGLWSTVCIQSQDMTNSGFMIESYDISLDSTRENSAHYSVNRQWYADAACTQHYATDMDHGTIRLGKKLRGMMISGETYEADFESPVGVDLGAVKVEGNKLKVARGMRGSTFRNTMVGLFDYVKK
jgi:hypothetical protein